MKTKLFSVLFLTLLVFLSNTSIAWAQTTNTDGPSSSWFYTPGRLSNEAEKGQPALGGGLFISQMSLVGAFSRRVGFGEETVLTDASGKAIGYTYKGGMVGSMETILAKMTIDQGVSSKEYLADLGHNLGIVPKEAFAQGAGFTGLAPVLPLWKLMRDIAYLFYVVIFFVVGFMILLRKKIDPRTVITVEAALPKLVITLILITFSYAIMGFVLDLANLASVVIGNLFVNAGMIASARGITLDKIISADIFNLVHPITNVTAISRRVELALIASGNNSVMAWATGQTFSLVFLFATLFITFKIFFALLGPFVGIFLSVIFAPLQLLVMSIPGSEANFGNFLKGFIAKVAVFPVTWALFIIAAVVGDTQRSCLLGCQDWGIPDTKLVNMQNINVSLVPFAGWGPVVGNIIAFGIIFTIPSVAQFVQNALKVKDQSGDIATQTIRKGMSKVPFMKGLAE